MAPPASPDPAGAPLADRRAALAAAGGESEAVIWHDVTVRSRRGEQRNVTVAGRLTAWEQGGHVRVGRADLGRGVRDVQRSRAGGDGDRRLGDAGIEAVSRALHGPPDAHPEHDPGN